MNACELSTEEVGNREIEHIQVFLSRGARESERRWIFINSDFCPSDLDP